MDHDPLDPDEPPPPPPRWVTVAVTVFGLGRARAGGGTLGALVAIPIGVWLATRSAQTRVVVCALVVLAAHLLIRRYLASTSVEDPPEVVIDELAGTLVALQLVDPSVLATVLAFGLFRAFDIFKPWPINAAERLGGAQGVLADDLAAGVLAGLGTRALLAFIGT